jgi:DNA invertase Pin-like site-specific DNA recombinase
VTKTTGTRAAIYVRISDDPSEEGRGIERQEEDLLHRAEREGLTVVQTYRENDTGASRHSRKKRTEYPKMMEAAERGEFDVIMADSLTRLSRIVSEREALVDLVERKGTRILTLKSGDPNLTSADGLMLYRFLTANDAAESDRISERLKRQQAQARADGRDLGKRPFGWGSYAEEKPQNGRRKVVDRDKLNDTEGPALAHGIRDVLMGKSLASIAKAWTKAGVPRPGSADAWTVSLVKTQLVRWRNAGVVVHMGEPVDGVTGTWETACTREELERTRSILLNPDRNTRKGGPTPSALLTGVATCGKCGRSMQRGTDHSRTEGRVAIYRCAGFSFPAPKRCSTSMRLAMADAEVTRVLRNVLIHGPHDGLVPTDAEELRLTEIATELDEVAEGQSVVGAALAANPRAAKELVKALTGYQETYDGLVAERTAILGKYVLQSLLGCPVIDGKRLDMDRAAEIATELDDLDVSQRRELVKALLCVEIRRADDLRDWPADLDPRKFPEARVAVSLKATGQRLNPAPLPVC